MALYATFATQNYRSITTVIIKTNRKAGFGRIKIEELFSGSNKNFLPYWDVIY